MNDDISVETDEDIDARAGWGRVVNMGGMQGAESQAGAAVGIDRAAGSSRAAGSIERVGKRALIDVAVTRAVIAVESGHRESAQRDWQDNFDDADRGLRPFKTLTPEQADAVRRANPPISPWRVVRVQALAGLACVVAAAVLLREVGAVWSALYGAVAAVLPSALLARGMTRGTQGAVAAAAGFLFWEMLKIGVAIAMLVIAAKVVPHLSWPVLLATMVVCIKVNWLALSWRGR